MNKKKRRRQRITLAVIVCLIIAVIIAVKIDNERSDTELRAELLAKEWDFSGDNAGTYASYLSALKEDGLVAAPQADAIMIDASAYKSAVPSDRFEKNGTSLVTYAGGKVTYQFTVKKAGTYRIEVGYVPTSDSRLPILRNIYINGELPFAEAQSVNFDRRWVDADKDFLMKSDTNQGAPVQVQAPENMSTQLESSDRSAMGPFLFYLEAGKNTLTFEAEQSTLELTYINLIPSGDVETYEEYLAQHATAARITAAQMGGDPIVTVQAEDTLWKSSAVLMPQNDRTSAVTVPYHYSNIVLNTIGGASWDQAGTGITWKIEVPAAGMYRIATRFMQAENRDFFSGREVRINGELPFREAWGIPFYYDSEFQVEYLGDENGAYYFYLNEGENTITMTVTLGDLSYAKEQTAISVRNFNALFRELTAIMGSKPDTYRDYDITSSVEDMVDIMSREYVRLTKVMESVGDTLDENTKSRSIAKLLKQLEVLIRKPNKIAKEYATFSDNITAVADWMLSLDAQPLQLDYIMVCGEDAKLPKAEGNFFQNRWHDIRAFVGSFTNDYSLAADNGVERDKKIVVWIATGTRDQYDIAQRMVNNAFRDSDFNIELKMVGAGTVMPATMTGNGPDVAIQLDYSMPTNFAYRGAGYDLTQFSDYSEIASRFAPGAIEYFEYNGGVYALPDEISFPVMFYRKDILESLGLEVPKTWDELIALLPYLQSDNMQVYFSSGTATLGGATTTASKPVGLLFMSLLYQNGVELYRNGGAQTNLDSLDAGLVFKKWVEFYTKQSFPLSVSTTTRFRTGEIPIIIEDYTFINTLKAAAPEIEGSWSIAPIPATVREDGTLDNTTTCIVGASMIIKPIVEAKDTVNEAWEFLKWWTSEEVQLQYADELKSILGDAAEFPIANMDAIRTRAAVQGNSETIEAVFEHLRGVPQVPGGYITGREVDNAFLESVNSLYDPVNQLYTKVRAINNELRSKREEFGLPTE